MQLNRGRLMLVTLFGVLALGALTAAAAQAVEAPRWSIKGTDLGAGETHFITAKAYSTNFKLRTGNITVTCTTIKLKEGSLLGSAPENAGKNSEVIEFNTCTVSGKTGGKTISECGVEPIVTVPVESELVESEGAKPAEKKGSLLVLFVPLSGASFATITFFPLGPLVVCPPPTKVTGKVASQVFTDPNTPPTLGTLVTLESGATEAISWLLNFPATQPKKVVRIIKGETKEEANPGLTAGAEEAVLEGVALILLAKREANGELVTEETKWSPLP